MRAVVFLFSMLPQLLFAASNVPRPDFMPCLKALNENSALWKDGLVALDTEGVSFVIKDKKTGTMTVVLEHTKHWVTDSPAKCNTYDQNDSLREIRSLYDSAMHDPKTSSEDKKVIVHNCQPLANTSWTPSKNSSNKIEK